MGLITEIVPRLPKVSLQVNGRELLSDGVFFRSLSRIEISDQAGYEEDSLQLEVPAEGIAPPNSGDIINVLMDGVDTGEYTVDSVEMTLSPALLSVTAGSAGYGGEKGAQVKRSRSFADGETLGSIAEVVAREVGLTAVVNENFSNIVPGQVDQTEESGVNMLARLGGRFGYYLKIRSGRLLLLPRWGAVSASGQEMPAVKILDSDISSAVFRQVERSKYDVVEARWTRYETGQDDGIYKYGEGARVYVIREPYASEQAAQAGALAQFRTLNATGVSMSVTLPGSLKIFAGGRVELINVPNVMSGVWSVQSARHEVSDSGYVTSVTLRRILGD